MTLGIAVRDANADDRVEPVRRYCEVLADVSARIDATSDSLEELGQRLADVDAATGHGWDQLKEALSALILAAGSDDDSEHPLMALAAAAEEQRGHLGSLEDALHTAEEALTAHLQRAQGALAPATLIAESRGYGRARAHLEQCAQEIEAALGALEGEVVGAVNGLLAAEGQIDAAAAAATESGSGVVAAAQEAQGRFEDLTESARAQGAALDATATREEDALTALYGELGDSVTQAAARLSQTLLRLGEDAHETLDAAARALADTESEAIESARQWAAELEALTRALEAGEAEAAGLRPHLVDIEISKRVVAELHDVIEAMDT